MREAMARHCLSVYDQMTAESELDEREKYQVFRGSTTAIFDNLGISRTFYSSVLAALEEEGYISRMGRDGVILHSRPTYSELLLTTPVGSDTVPLVKRLEALESALGGLDLKDVLDQLNHRLNVVESIVNTAHMGTHKES
jgi:hypothetical protein